MRILPKLFDKETAQEEAPLEQAPESGLACPHTILIAHWDSVADMGDETKATAFVCEACGEVFQHDAQHRRVSPGLS